VAARLRGSSFCLVGTAEFNAATPVPKTCAITGLRYAPIFTAISTYGCRTKCDAGRSLSRTCFGATLRYLLQFLLTVTAQSAIPGGVYPEFTSGLRSEYTDLLRTIKILIYFFFYNVLNLQT